MSSGLSFYVDGDTLYLTLSSPEKSNAFGVNELGQMQSALKFGGKIKYLVMTSQGSRSFCSGGDMKFYAGLKSRVKGLDFNRKIAKTLSLLAAKPVVSVAYVNGDCLGGGIELLSSFDVVWCAPHVRFGFWQRRIGLTFGWGGYQRLRRRLNVNRLQQLALAGSDISAFQAQEWGLVDALVLPQQWREKLQRLMISTRDLPVAPVSIIKKLPKEKEESSFAKLWEKKEHREALIQFVKRGTRT